MPSSHRTSPAAMAFATCLFTVFVDIMGQQFLSPVLVPYAEYLEATLDETGIPGAITRTAGGGGLGGVEGGGLGRGWNAAHEV